MLCYVYKSLYCIHVIHKKNTDFALSPQDRYSNMPYLSWLLLPAGINHTILTLEGAAMKVTVEIKVMTSCAYSCWHDAYCFCLP